LDEAFETSDASFEVPNDTFEASDEAFETSSASFRLWNDPLQAANKAFWPARATQKNLLDKNVAWYAQKTSRVDYFALRNGSGEVHVLFFKRNADVFFNLFRPAILGGELKHTAWKTFHLPTKALRTC
jgi:hypothetical protein